MADAPRADLLKVPPDSPARNPVLAARASLELAQEARRHNEKPGRRAGLFCCGPGWQVPFETQHLDLVVLAATPHRPIGESSASAVVAARLGAAVDHITSCFQDPELSLATVARSLRISPRYLQRLLETSGTSLTARVNELRLQRAFTLLTEAGDSARRISDIALDVGFSDISHFNRLFRSRFGDTPSGVRAQGRRAQ